MSKLILLSTLYAPIVIAMWTAGMPNPAVAIRKFIRLSFAFYVLWVLFGPWLYFKFPPSQ